MERWVYLDAVRGLAAIMVAVFHYQGLFTEKQFFDFGYLAVDLFFVLSGMVMQAMYGEAIARGSLGVREFALVRLRRLYPMVVLGLLAVASLNLCSVPPSNVSTASWISLARSVLLLPELGTSNAFPANGPLWSLMSEVVVNSIWFATVRLGGMRAFAALTALAVPAALLLIGAHGGSANFGWQGDVAQLLEGCVRALGAFCAGAMLTTYRVAVDNLFSRVPAAVTLLLAGVLLLSRAVLQMAFPLVADVAPIMGCVVALCALRRWTPPRGLIHPFVWLGSISYPVYLLHAPLGRALAANASDVSHLSIQPFYGFLLAKMSTVWLTTPGVGGVYLMLLLALSTAAHYVYEKPLQRRLRGQR
ncbi:acyltransferase family protein [Burkholderia cenocepacia]|uniref:acyltransferase family protein n=1 Tax=Burkholderia cenocepacia TaxID=95486 RepID=UPI000760C843|nr:acyltransferase [Burkholderia cenocepacia]KWU26285.1 hypothetical protein AS149_25170 [Burkholderia cenocepacia]